MMQSKKKNSGGHTPSPWFLEEGSDESLFWIKSRSGEYITSSEFCDAKEILANGRLIAAAPELLEALLEMTEDYCELCREEGRNGDCEKFPEESEHPIYPVCENVKRAKKAISKAKGKE